MEDSIEPHVSCCCKGYVQIDCFCSRCNKSFQQQERDVESQKLCPYHAANLNAVCTFGIPPRPPLCPTCTSAGWYYKYLGKDQEVAYKLCSSQEDDLTRDLQILRTLGADPNWDVAVPPDHLIDLAQDIAVVLLKESNLAPRLYPVEDGRIDICFEQGSNSVFSTLDFDAETKDIVVFCRPTPCLKKEDISVHRRRAEATDTPRTIAQYLIATSLQPQVL